MDELNHDCQALALEGRTMGEVRVQEPLPEVVCRRHKGCDGNEDGMTVLCDTTIVPAEMGNVSSCFNWHVTPGIGTRFIETCC